MLQVSDNVKKYIESDTRTFRARLLLDRKEISGDIRSLSINKGSCGSSDFAPGSVFSSYIDVTLDGCNQKLEGKELTLQIGTVMENSVEWTAIGLFTVDKPSTSAYSTSFSGLGRISSKMGGLYNPAITFPATVKAVLSEISSATGVKVATGSLDTSIVIETKPSGYMYREMLAFIAGFYFGYATEAADGSVIIRQYQKTATASTNGDKTTELPTFQDLDAEVTGVKVVVGTETDSEGNSQDKFFTKGTVNVAVSNPFMTQAIFNKYVDSFIGFQYRPATVNVTTGDFRLEATDTLSVTDVKGVEHIVPCMAVTHTFDGGIQTAITAPAIKDTGDSAQSFRGPLNQAVSVIQAQLLIVESIAAKALTVDKADIKYAQIKDLDVVKENVETLVADNVTINSKLTANEASINSLIAKDAEIDGKLTAQDASIKKLDAEKLSAEDANLTYATIESLKATDATITNLSGDYASFKDTTTETLKAQTADIVDLKANKLSATDADIRYANIDFTNIGKAAMEYFYAQSGLIKDVTVGDQTITGELVGVTIKGDLIAGNTIVADKIVMKGNDGLYYKLNTDGATVEKEQTDYNSLKGSILQAKSVTAEKISVKDLVAFGATIGGVNIADSSIYSGVKSSVNNTTRGFYLGKDGQAAFGDASNYLKYFQDTDGTWKLAIAADSVSLKSGTNVGDAIESLQESGGFNWNLIPKSKNLDLQTLESTMSATRTDSDCTLTVKTAVGESSQTWGALYSNLIVEKNQWYTASVEVTNIDVSEYSSAAMFTVCKNSPVSGAWNDYGLTRISAAGKYKITFNSGDNTAIRVCVGVIRKAISNTATFQNIKLEKGSVATAWTPTEAEIYGKDGAAGKDGTSFSWNLLRKSQEIFLNGSDYPNNSTQEQGKITVLSSGVPFDAYTWVEDHMVISPEEIAADAGATYAFSADIKTTDFDGTFSVYFSFDLRLNWQVQVSKLVPIPSNKNGEWQRLSGTIIIPSDLYSDGTWRSLICISAPGGANAKAGAVFEYRNFKLERGSTSTDWTPAEEEVYGKSLITLITDYSYPQADINIYGKSGYSGTWNVTSSDGVKAGDTVLLRINNTTKSGYSYIIATVTAIPRATAVTCTSTGLLDKGETGSDGVNGKSMVVVPLSYTGGYYANYNENIIKDQITNRKRDSYSVTSTSGVKIGDIALCWNKVSDTGRFTYVMLLVDTVNSSSNSIGGTVIGQTTGTNGATGPQGATGAQGKPGIDFSQGKMLYTDPMFKIGFNGISLYDNSNSGNVKLWRATKSADSPISGSDYEIRIQNTGTANPSLGGFYFGTQSRCNAIFVYRIIAYIPSGYTINFASNTAGGVYAGEWLTSNVGDGNYREYVYRIQCGRNGQYSSTGFFYLDGTAGTTDNPVTWYVTYATCYDMTATSDVISLNASLEVEKGNIAALASRTSSVEGRISTAESSIKQNADAISLKVSQSDFNNLQIGSGNLLYPHSGNYTADNYTKFWGNNGGGLTLDTSVTYRGYYTVKTTVGSGLYGRWARTEIGQVYTCSMMVRCNVAFDYSGNVTPLHYWQGYSSQTNDRTVSIISSNQKGAAGTWTLLYMTFTASGTWFRPFLYIGDGSTSRVFNVAYVKLEKGNRATDWTPAPEDQVGIGDVCNQLNSELKIDGNILAMTTGHFLVNATNLTITSDGTLTAKNGVFSGKLEAATGTFAGSLSAASGTFKGDITGATGNFAGNIRASTIKIGSTSDDATAYYGLIVNSNGGYIQGSGRSRGVVYAGNGEATMTAGLDGAKASIACTSDELITINATSIKLNGTTYVNGSIIEAQKRTDSSYYHKDGYVCHLHCWMVLGTTLITTVPERYRPKSHSVTLTGWCRNAGSNTYYPCIAMLNTSGAWQVYAMTSFGGAPYVIYEGSTDRRSAFYMLLTGSWVTSHNG